MDIAIDKTNVKFLRGLASAQDVEEWLEQHPDIVGVVFAGRSNVGKSSLINSLFGKGVARTSKTPGRTREINLFQFNLANIEDLDVKEIPPFFLIDLPGYGYANISKADIIKWDQLMTTFFSNITVNMCIISIQDARHPMQEKDESFYHFLKSYDYQTYLAFNKMDKLKTQKEKLILKKKMPGIYQKYKWIKQIHFTSAEKRTGIKELEQGIISFLLEGL